MFSSQPRSFLITQLSFRSVYYIVAFCLLFLFAFPLRLIPFLDWPHEQQIVVSLLIALLFFNNPLFFCFLITSNFWLTEFLDFALQIGYVCFLIIIWFYYLDCYQITYNRKQMFCYSYLKYAFVIFWGVISIFGYAVYNHKLYLDPTVYTNKLTWFLLSTFVMYSLLCGLLIGIIVLFILSTAGATEIRYVKRRFGFITLPSIFTALSILLGLFLGHFGTYNRSMSTFLYFYGLFNSYTYLLAIGFFPSLQNMSTGFTPSVLPSDPELIDILFAFFFCACVFLFFHSRISGNKVKKDLMILFRELLLSHGVNFRFRTKDKHKYFIFRGFSSFYHLLN